jgi:citrate lyase subunit beta/citryl-CoA lyase
MVARACSLLHATSGAPGETARGILAAAGMAHVANCVGLMQGIEDLVADLGGRRGRALRWPVLEHARSAVLIAARAVGQAAIDTVLADITDAARLRADSEVAVA